MPGNTPPTAKRAAARRRRLVSTTDRTIGWAFLLYGMSLASGQALSLAVAYACLGPGHTLPAGHQCQRQLEAVWSYQTAATTGLLNLIGGAGLAIAAQKRDRHGGAGVNVAQTGHDSVG